MPPEQYSKKQKALAKIAVPFDKITAADLEKIRGKSNKKNT